MPKGSSLPFARPRLIIATLVLAFTALVSLTPAAQGASFTYANAIMTPENQARYSGLRTNVTGGFADVNIAIGTVTIVSYKESPGYREIAKATSYAAQPARLSHQATGNSYSRCFWTANSGGSARLTCRVNG